MSGILKFFRYFFYCVLLVLIVTVATFYVDYKSEVSALVENAMPNSNLNLAPEESISFMLIGDLGKGNKPQKDVALQMERRCRKKIPEGIMILGDVVNPDGVSSATDPQWQDKVFSIYSGKCLSSVPIFPVLGNHDYHGNVASWVELAKTNERWRFPSRHYSITYQDLITFYALDTQHPAQIKSHGIPDFGNSQSKWTIALGHHPIQSQSEAGGGHQGKSIRSWYLKHILCDKVDIYFSGHAHQMEYSHIDECNMAHVISGGGGSHLYPVKLEGNAEFSVSEYGFTELELDHRGLSIRFFSNTGEVMFRKTVEKNMPY